MRLFAVPALADNYIWVAADVHGNALVVDPGEAAPVEALIARERLRVTTILLTHHHPDHIAGAAALAAQRTLRVIAPQDRRISSATEHVTDGERIELACPAMSFSTLHVPGHTLSHLAFVGEGLLFCGDTLFSLGCGRLFEGSPEQMLDSLDRLAQLPAATQVCCGHEYTLANAAFALAVDGDNPALAARLADARARRAANQPSVPSTMGEERAANPFLRIDTPALRTWARRHAPQATSRSERFAALRAAKDDFRA